MIVALNSIPPCFRNYDAINRDVYENHLNDRIKEKAGLGTCQLLIRLRRSCEERRCEELQYEHFLGEAGDASV
jgi:hypothetical protein